MPDQIIYGVAYNTNTWGYAPIGQPGPYESLNYGLATVAAITAGSNPFPDTAYWNTMQASFYADGGAGGVGTFRRDTDWTPYIGAISFTAPNPPALQGAASRMVQGTAGTFDLPLAP